MDNDDDIALMQRLINDTAEDDASFQALLNAEFPTISAQPLTATVAGSEDITAASAMDMPNPFEFSLFDGFEETPPDVSVSALSRSPTSALPKPRRASVSAKKGRNDVAEHWRNAAKSMLHISDAFKNAPLLRGADLSSDDDDGDGDDLDGSREDSDNDDDEEQEEAVLDSDDLGAEKLELEQEIDLMGPRKKRSAARKALGGGAIRSHLTPDQRRSLGQANSAFLENDYEKALATLTTLARNSTKASEPYHTMAMIYEELGDPDKSLLFYMVAAHLRMRDAALWRRIADITRGEVGKRDEFGYCLRMAYRADNSDLDTLRELIDYYVEENKTHKALAAMLRLLRAQPDDVDLAQDVARLQMENGDIHKAALTMESTLKLHGIDVTNLHATTSLRQPSLNLDHYNMLAELYIMDRNFSSAHRLLEHAVRTCNGSFTSVPVDLQAKLAICMIQLGLFSQVVRYLEALERVPLADIPDIYLDIGLAFYDTGRWTDALSYCEKATSVPGFEGGKDASVLLRMGECYQHTAQELCALEKYAQFIELFPEEYELRFVLADLADSLGMETLAADSRRIALSRQFEESSSHPSAESKKEGTTPEMRQIIHRIGAIRAQDRRQCYEQCASLFGKEGEDLTEADCDFLRRALRNLVADFQASPRFFPSKTRIRPFNEGRRKKGDHKSKDEDEDSDDEEQQQQLMDDDDDVSEEQSLEDPRNKKHLGLGFEEWYRVNLFYAVACAKKAKILQTRPGLSSTIQNTNIQRLFNEAVGTLRIAFRCNVIYYNKENSFTCKWALLGVSLLAENYTLMYETYQWLMREHSNQPGMTLFHQLLFSASPSVTTDLFANRVSQKYFTRQTRLSKYKNAYLLTTEGQILGLNRMFPGSLAFLARANGFLPVQEGKGKGNALIFLNMAVSQMHRAMARTTVNRNLEVLKAFAFFESYREARCAAGGVGDEGDAWKEQEVEYNMGRLFEFVGLFDLAVGCYRKVLEIGERGVVQESHNLTAEAEHNLFLIMMSVSGNDGMAGGFLRVV